MDGITQFIALIILYKIYIVLTVIAEHIKISNNIKTNQNDKADSNHRI